MKNIIIDFLSEADHHQDIYTSAMDFTTILQPFIVRLKTDKEVYDFLKTIKSDDDWVMITFLSHSNTEYLGMRTDGSHYKLYYKQLINAIDDCVTTNNVFLNLVANCESFGIEKYLTSGLKIAEIWVSTIKTPTARMALMAAYHENFEVLNAEHTRDEMQAWRRIVVR